MGPVSFCTYQKEKEKKKKKKLGNEGPERWDDNFVILKVACSKFMRELSLRV